MMEPVAYMRVANRDVRADTLTLMGLQMLYEKGCTFFMKAADKPEEQDGWDVIPLYTLDQITKRE